MRSSNVSDQISRALGRLNSGDGVCGNGVLTEKIEEQQNDIEIPSKEDLARARRTTFAAASLNELQVLATPARSAALEVENQNSNEWSVSYKDEMRLFFIYSGILQEYYLKHAVVEHVFPKKRRTDQLLEMVWNMTPQHCINFLFATGVIDAGMKGEIGQAKDERNKLAHSISHWLFTQPDPQHIQAQIGRAERSSIRLIDLVGDFEIS